MINKKILLTGGFGFIGSNWIINNFKNNFIVNVDNFSKGSNQLNIPNEIQNHQNYKTISKNICDLNIDDLNGFQPDCIIHFAAESHVDRSITNPLGFVKTNVLGTTNLLELTRIYFPNSLFMHVSTDEVFGHLEDSDEPFDENTPYAPRSPYSASKASSDHIVKAYHQTYGLNVKISNCCNNFGPRQDNQKLIPKVISNALDKQPIPIYGNGLNKREWIFVDDHNSALNLIIENGLVGHTYCIGSGVELDNLTLVNNICDLLNEIYPNDIQYKSLITFVDDRKGHDFRYAINNEKIKKQLNFSPKHSFNQGLIKTINWYLNNRR